MKITLVDKPPKMSKAWEAAKQMYFAYKEIVLGEKMDFESFGASQKYHLGLNPDGMIYM